MDGNVGVEWNGFYFLSASGQFFIQFCVSPYRWFLGTGDEHEWQGHACTSAVGFSSKIYWLSLVYGRASLVLNIGIRILK